MLTIQPEDVLRAADDLLYPETAPETAHDPARQPAKPSPPHDWIARWQRVARRIRVPLGFLDGGALPLRAVVGAPPARRRGLESGAGCAGPVAARLRLRLRKKEPRTDRDRPLRAHPQPALSGLDADRRRLCRGAAQLAGGAGARPGVCGDLCAGDRLGGALSARHVPRFRRLLPPRAAPDSAPDLGAPFQRQFCVGGSRLPAAFPCRFTSSTASTMQV